MNIDKSRNNVIDIAKLIGIFLVVFGHTIKNNNVHRYIYAFHMPLFFIISGMTFLYTEKHNYTPKEFLIKKTKTILIPYFFFLTCSFIYWSTIERHVRANPNTDIVGNLLNIFLGFAKAELFESNIVMWFLPCLFMTEIIYFLIRKYMRSRISISMCTSVCSILGFSLNYYKVFLPFGIEVSLIALLFLHSGYLFNKYIASNNISNKWSIVILLLSIVVNIMTIKYNGNVGMLAHEYGNPLLYVFGAYSGSINIFVISNLLGKLPNFICYRLVNLGKNSLIIMIGHEPIKRILIKVSSILLSKDISVIRENFLYSICITVITIIIMIAVAKIIYMYVPQVIGKSKRKGMT